MLVRVSLTLALVSCALLSLNPVRTLNRRNHRACLGFDEERELGTQFIVGAAGYLDGLDASWRHDRFALWYVHPLTHSPTHRRLLLVSHTLGSSHVAHHSTRWQSR